MIWRDYSLNSNLSEIIKRYLDMSLENIKLRKELQTTKKELKKKLKNKLENKQKVIRYYRKENKKLRDDVEYFRQIYLDLKKMCEDDGYLLTDEEVTKLFNLDEIGHKK